MNKIKITKFMLTALAFQMSYVQMSSAMQVLEDQDLRKVDGQDGLQVNLEFDQVDIERAYWSDNTGVAGTTASQRLEVSAHDAKIRHNQDYLNGNYNLGATVKLNAGSDGTKSGLDFDLQVNPFTFSAQNFCIQVAGSNCTESIGNFAVQTGSNTNIRLTAKDGLFNRNEQAELILGLKNINIYTGLKANSAATTNIYDQLILRNTNFNFYGKGVAYIDDTYGFVVHTNTGFTPGQEVAYGVVQTPANYGYVDLTRVALPANQQTGNTKSTYYDATTNLETGSGLNLEFMLKSNTNLGSLDTPQYSLDGSKGLIRLGASGRIVNGYMQFRGINAESLAAPSYNYANGVGTNTANNVLGYATQAGVTTTTNSDDTVIGSSGIGLRVRGEFTKSGDSMLGADGKAVALEIGGAGPNSFGFEFGELHPLIYNSKQRAYFDSGNVYLNLANTQHLKMPVNTVLTNQSRFGGSNSFLTSIDDYNQRIHGRDANSPNPYSIVMAIRGADFQSVSHRGRFTSNAGTIGGVDYSIPATSGLDNKWGLGLPFYNLNTNIALYPTTYAGQIYQLSSTTASGIAAIPVPNVSQRLGFALALSVDGRNAAGTKTTSIMVVDSANKYYVGMRNIDMYLRGYGSIGFEQGQLNINLPDVLMVMAAELAAGKLPSFADPNNANSAINNSFQTKSDVFLGLKLKLLGDMNLSLLPHNAISDGNKLSIIGRYKLTSGTVQLSDPIDDSMIGLDNMQGVVDFKNALVVAKDTVGFNFGFTLNPDKNANDVFRVKDVNLYPPLTTTTSPPGQRLGELALTGGRMNINMGITPRNGGFTLK